MGHGEEVFGQLIVAGCDPAEVLRLGEEALDQVALAIQPFAKVRFRPPVGLGRDIGESSFLAERCSDTIGVIRLIREDYRSSTNMVQQIVSGLAIMALPGGKFQSDREALSVDDRVDFGRETASGATETISSARMISGGTMRR
ncbi:hypothetical protein HY11_06625 [Hyphomonas pacifica]|nr:hypothetical protein HY11_06625 [Hyphomonas pacifica]